MKVFKIAFTKYGFLFFAGIYFNLNIFAQGTWIQKNAIWTGCYSQSNAQMVINNKAYIGVGTDFCFDWFEFDPVLDTYTAKANFPDTASSAPATFSINGFGYMLSDNNVLWKYDPLLNSWTNTGSNFPGVKRGMPYFFTIGSKGYLGGGSSEDGVFSLLQDFWEYNSTSNIWTPLANMPIGNTIGEAFSLNGKGYLTGGQLATGGSNFTMKVFQYDPLSNAWMAKNDFPDGRYAASSFVIGNDAYVGMGIVNGSSGSDLPYTSVYKYNELADSWTSVADIPFADIYDEGVGFSLNGKGYMGLGDCSGFLTGECMPFYQSHIFEYTPQGLGLHSNEIESTIQIFPNPTAGEISIISSAQQISGIEIYNTLGEKVLERNNYISLKVDLDLSNLAKGIYVLHFLEGNQMISKKIILE